MTTKEVKQEKKERWRQIRKEGGREGERKGSRRLVTVSTEQAGEKS